MFSLELILTQTPQLKRNIDVVNNSLTEVEQCENFKIVLGVVRQTGNILNRGRTKGNAQGFRLSLSISLIVALPL